MKAIVLSERTGDMVAMRERRHEQGFDIGMAGTGESLSPSQTHGGRVRGPSVGV